MQQTNRPKLFITAFLLTIANQALAQQENMDTIADIHHLAAYLVAGLLIAVFVMIFSNRVYYYRQKTAFQDAQQKNAQLELVLDHNKTQVWTYDPAGESFTMFFSQSEEHTNYSAIEFSLLFDNDDFSKLIGDILSISKGERKDTVVQVRGRLDKQRKDTHQRYYDINVSVLRRDAKGKPVQLLGIQRDVTDEQLKVTKAASLQLRYRTVFNSSLVDMIYYDADGIMTDINDKACETFEVKDRKALLAAKPRLNDVPAVKDVNIQELDRRHASAITPLNEVRHPMGDLSHDYWGTDKTYYEHILSATRDAEGRLTGIVMAGLNITEMVESQHHQKWAGQQLAKKTKDVQNYIDNINYSLRVSNVRMVNYYPARHELEVYGDLKKLQYRLSQARCITLVCQHERSRIRGLFMRMDRQHGGDFRATIETIFRDKQGRHMFLTFSMVPVTDKDGTQHYFGMVQDNTEMIYTERRLQEESMKAQEAEQLKTTFLANMSHEIRTPLNAVLGFAELFNNPHADEDEPVFAEEIKRNTAELLQLVNDILYISRLDAGMEEMQVAECDFALLFEGLCYMGWSTVGPNVRLSAENPYNHLVVKINEQHLGRVIQQLCEAAARYTSEGTIRAKYEYRHGELNISIEDTGLGMSKEALKRSFERFSRNQVGPAYTTGLEMPIVKEMIEQMGGSLELQSEEGKGTTSYIIIPCELKSMDKKQEMNI